MVLKGKLVKIRRAIKLDIPTFLRWFEDEELSYLTLTPPFRFLSKDIERTFKESDRFLIFIIETIQGSPIGYISLSNIRWESRNAEINIAIGEKKYWNLLYGGEAYVLFLDYFFNTLNMYKIYGIIVEYNTRHINLAEKAKFTKEGILRRHFYSKGKYYDGYIYSLLAEEYQELKKQIDKFYK